MRGHSRAYQRNVGQASSLALEFGHFLPVSRRETLEFGQLTVMIRATADFVPHFVAHFVAQGLEPRHHGADPA